MGMKSQIQGTELMNAKEEEDLKRLREKLSRYTYKPCRCTMDEYDVWDQAILDALEASNEMDREDEEAATRAAAKAQKSKKAAKPKEPPLA
jgi:hypothetical protein